MEKGYAYYIARRAAIFRGHRLDDGKTVTAGNGREYHDHVCDKCGMEFRYTPKPMPNETFSSGEALARDCI